MREKNFDLKKYLFNFSYFMLWGFPFFIFIKDFFTIDFISVDFFNLVFIKNSLIQGFLTVFFSIIIAVFPAYYVSYRRDWLSSAMEKLFFIPFIFPAISAVISFTIIYGTGLVKYIDNGYSLRRIIIANCFYNSPIMVKYISEALRKIPKELSEAAGSDGVTEIDIFLKIKIPLIMPQIFKGSFIVFLYSFVSFILVIALGGIRYSTMEAEIASTLTGSLDFSKVIALGGIQGAILLGINFLSKKIPEYELSGNGQIKGVSIFVKILSIIYFLFEILVIIIPIYFSFYDFFTGKFSIEPYRAIFSKEFNMQFPVIQALLNSSLISAAGSILIVTGAYFMLKFYSKATDILVFSTFGISSAFLGIVLIYLNIKFNIPLSILLAQGYILTTLPLAYSFLYQHIKKFNKEIYEAARIDGAGGIATFFHIEFPLLKRIFIGVFIQIFAVLFGEFTMAYTMQIGSYFPTISLVNYSMVSSKRFLESSAVNTLILIFLGGIFYISHKFLLEKTE